MDKIFNAEEPVYIVGGGESLRTFNWGNLEGKQVIAVNTAFRKLSTATCMFFNDPHFYSQWRDANPDGDFWRFKGRIYSSIETFKDHPHIRLFDVAGAFKKDKIKLKGANAGVEAIMLAKALGAAKIVLLGFDGKGKNWHTGTPLQHRRSASHLVHKKYEKEFEAISDSKLGVDIINANDSSAITCFDVMALNDALNLTME